MQEVLTVGARIKLGVLLNEYLGDNLMGVAKCNAVE